MEPETTFNINDSSQSVYEIILVQVILLGSVYRKDQNYYSITIFLEQYFVFEWNIWTNKLKYLNPCQKKLELVKKILLFRFYKFLILTFSLLKFFILRGRKFHLPKFKTLFLRKYKNVAFRKI